MTTATLEKSNGHKLAKQSHEAPSPSARKRKEGHAVPHHNRVPSAGGAVARAPSLTPRAKGLKPETIPPGATSTTTPEGIRRLDPAAINDPAAITGQEIECDLALLHPHPDNRRSSDDDGDVEQLAESIRVDNLIQAITVRIAPEHWDLPAGHYQIVCGERRWRACRVAGRGSVRCKVRADLDDAATLRIIATENALRRDLNPIEKARLIDRLCASNEDGSKALTREEAAQVVGLESGGAASNMARLLNLPEAWQQRIAAGELAWSWAQEIYPYLAAEPVMVQLDRAWQQPDPFDNIFASRQELSRGLATLVHNTCRRLDGAKIDLSDAGLKERLEIVELPDPEAVGKRKLAAYATNVKLFDEAIKKQAQRAAKSKAGKVGQEEPPKAAARSDAKADARDKIEAAERRSAALQEAVAGWRHRLLQRAVAMDIERGRGFAIPVVLAYAMEQPLDRRFPPLVDFVRARSGEQWSLAGKFADAGEGAKLLNELAARLLRTKAIGGPIFETDFIERLAIGLGLDVENEWLALQQPVSKTSRELAGGDLLEEFFLLFRAEELHAVAKSIEVHVPGATKEKLIEVLLNIPRGSTRRLKLPKAIAPLAIPGGKKAKGKVSRGGAKARRGK